MLNTDKQIKLEECIREILNLLGENPARNGLLHTPKRVAKSLDFMTSGYYEDPKNVLNDALFESTNNEMVLIKNIEFYCL